MFMALITLLAGLVLLGAAWFAVTYVLYILVMTLDSWRQRAPSDLAELGLIGAIVPLAFVGWVLDVGFNWSYGLALGKTRHPTLSSKLQYLRRVARNEVPDTYGIARPWRVAVANFVCERLLNPFEKDGHC